MSDPTPGPDEAASGDATAPVAGEAVRESETQASSSATAARDDGAQLVAVLTSRGYRGLLLVSALIGVPIALVAWGFLEVVHGLEILVWETVPEDLGMHTPSPWYAVLVLAIAGLVVGVAVAKLPGTGGHIPVHGLGGGTPLPVELPAIVIAAIASLVLGAVVGPEAPLVAIGAGLVVLVLRPSRLRDQPQGLQLLAVAGSAAAIATVFGNPVVGAVLMLEVVGFSGAQVLLALLPSVMAAGVGALVFTGLGSWTGIDAPTLAIPGLTEANIDVADLLWTVPVSIGVALLAQAARRVGLLIAGAASRRTMLVTTTVGLVVGLCAAAYSLITDRPVGDVLFSGETALGELVSQPSEWVTGTLVLLLLFKGIAYAVSIGAFRGGPTFPALFLGAVVGILVGALPGLGAVAGIGVGMAAATSAVLRLPITSIVLVTLLLGSQAMSEIPLVMIAAVVGLVTAVSLDRRETIRPLKARQARSAG